MRFSHQQQKQYFVFNHRSVIVQGRTSRVSLIPNSWFVIVKDVLKSLKTLPLFNCWYVFPCTIHWWVGRSVSPVLLSHPLDLFKYKFLLDELIPSSSSVLLPSLPFPLVLNFPDEKNHKILRHFFNSTFSKSKVSILWNFWLKLLSHFQQFIQIPYEVVFTLQPQFTKTFKDRQTSELLSGLHSNSTSDVFHSDVVLAHGENYSDVLVLFIQHSHSDSHST